MATAAVNHIIELSTVDGPGARTAIFLQGCNLACLYCHNPETQQLCRHCGICVPTCPTAALRINEARRVQWDKDKCIECDQCIKSCPFYSSPRVQVMTADELYQKIKGNLPFIRGITVSGGEATLYPEFLTDLFSMVKLSGKSTLVDANGTVDLSLLPDLMAVTDGVMLDMKAWDSEVFLRLCQVPSTGKLARNIVYLAESGKLEELRLVYVDNYVDGERCLLEAARLIPAHLDKVNLKLIKFRRFGVRGVLAEQPSPATQEMERLKQLAETLGFGKVVIR